MLKKRCAALALGVAAASLNAGLAWAQPAPPPEKMYQACKLQRDLGSDQQASLLAINSQLAEEVAKLKADIEKLKTLPPPAKK